MTQGYYDRDQTVAIITSFYQFFATLPIEYPPPGGWPNITPATHAALQKNDDVIDLYRHLPYLTYASDWRLQNIESKIQSEAVEESAVRPLSDHVAILTDGNKHGSYLLLDTQNGTITDFRKQQHPKPKEPLVGSPDHWKAYLTLPTSIFFESWKEKFRSREFLVIPENEDDGLLIGWDDPLREMHLAHGIQAAKAKKPQLQALYNFSAQEDNGVTLTENEVVSVLQKSSRGWSLARTASGSMGWVPSAYLEEIEVKPPAAPAVIKPTPAPPSPQSKAISQEQNQDKVQARVEENKERARTVAKEEQEPAWLYDMMDQIAEMKRWKLKRAENAGIAGQDFPSNIEEAEIEMKEFMAKLDAKLLQEAEQEFAAHKELAEEQIVAPKIREFEEWLSQWPELKQDKENAWYLEQDHSSEVENAERSMLNFKARIEAEIFASETESFEEDMFNTIVSEYEEWRGDPAEEERSFSIYMFGGMDWEDIQIEMIEAKARRDAEISEKEQQELVAEMEEDEETIERQEVSLFREHRWHESIVYP